MRPTKSAFQAIALIFLSICLPGTLNAHSVALMTLAPVPALDAVARTYLALNRLGGVTKGGSEDDAFDKALAGLLSV
jgi:hypothetical protein